MTCQVTGIHVAQRAMTSTSGVKGLVLVLVVVCVLWVSMCAHAEEASAMHRRWSIILKVTDLTTGATVEQRELDSDLRFDDRMECKSIVAKVGHIPASDHFIGALMCRKSGPAESHHVESSF